MTEILHLLELAQSRLKLAKIGLKLALKSLDEVHANLRATAAAPEPADPRPANDNRPPPPLQSA
ncbi:MAG: hypothetical protein ACFCUO_13665 [Rhodospirillales bacterium]